MSIHLGVLSPDTFLALQRISETKGWHPLHRYVEPEIVAWLTYRLETILDTDDAFPRGKWATIQRLQAMVRQHAIQQELGNDTPREPGS